MNRWYVWQFFSALNPLIFYSTFLYALIWSEVTGYNKLREEAIFNATGVDKRFMNEWKYLTRWNHLIQLLFWFISIIATIEKLFRFKNYYSVSIDSVELIKFFKKSTNLQKIQDAFFHCLAHPMAIVVTTLYWSMKLYDPSLLSSPSKNVPETPIVLDHIAHTVITVSCFIEFFLTYHRRPVWYWSVISPLVLLVSWLLFDEYLKAVHGFAVYNVLNTPLWTLIISIISVIFVFLISLVLTKLHYFYWTENRIDSYLLPPNIQSSSKLSYKA